MRTDVIRRARKLPDLTPQMVSASSSKAFDDPDGMIILIVDDNRDVAQLASEILRLAGFQTVIYTDGHEAISWFRLHHDHVRMVLQDMVLPDLDGRELFFGFRHIDPTVDIVLMSGFCAPDDISDLLHLGARAFLAKPFNIIELRNLAAKCWHGICGNS